MRRRMELFRDKEPSSATLKAFRSGPVLIWSGEHGAYWRPNGNGYTRFTDKAGRWTFDEALARTRHCGPEKRIVFERRR